MNGDIEKKLKEIWSEERKRFNYPAINDPVLVSLLEGQNSACFNWEKRRIELSKEFIERLSQSMSQEEVLRAALRHETGHWTYFPRELSVHLYLLAEADNWFGEKGQAIYVWYADLANEGSLLANGLAGEEILKLRKAFAEKATDEPSSMLNKLLWTLNANNFNFEKKPKLTEKEQKYFDKLKNIPYIDLDLRGHTASLYRFGKAIEDLIPAASCPSSSDSLEGIPEQELDGGLTGVLAKLGPRAYKLVKAYLKKVRPDFKDPFDAERKVKGVGFERTDFEHNDELIPLYIRLAASYGVYIVKRPMERDSRALYRCGKKEYEIGDPIQNIDIFGSRGIIGIPGISKVHLEEEGTIPSVSWAVPHLLVGLDSSGSMPHPASPKGALQVLAAFILGKNYYANGAYVGGWNFSTDIAFLNPSRDIEAYYSLMVGYWGGGTFVNIGKLKEFLSKYEFGKPELKFTDEKDYERALALIPKERQKEFLDKHLNLDLSKLKAKVAKLDNVLITDGYIANAEEVLQYLQGLGEVTRNFVFLTDKENYDKWSKIKLPNTWVYLAEKPEDLIDLAVGRSRDLVTEARF